MYCRLSYISRGVLSFKTLVHCIYRPRVTMQYIIQLYCGCYSQANAGRARFRAPITLAIAYSQASLRPGFLFSFFFVGHESSLWIHLLIKI
jgi:hypothetical protein